MSNLRELLNPERPEARLHQTDSAGQSTMVALVSVVKKDPSAEVANHNTKFDQDPLYDLDASYNLNTNVPAEEESGHPSHENCPDSLDCLPDTDDKPQHTLPVILRCAILGSAKRKLTIRDIYAAMEKKYPYYTTAGPAWKQSVRHHLSLSRLFERKAKPVTEPGFGSYWTVNLDAPPGTKRPRKRGRQNKSTSSSTQSGNLTNTEATGMSGRRGRPKKCPVQDYELEQTLKLPSVTSSHTSFNDYSALRIPSGMFTTNQLHVNGCSSQQYRLHSVHDVSSPNVENYDDDEMLDAHDHYTERHTPPLSDDAGDSIDNRSDGLAVYSYSGDPRTLPPPSISSVPVDPSLITSYNDPLQQIARLQEEVGELQRQIMLVSSAKASMERGLKEAHAEIAHLRARNDQLEQEKVGNRDAEHGL